MHRPPSPSSCASARRRRFLLHRGAHLVWLVVAFPDGLSSPLRWRLRLLSRPSVRWLGIPPPLVVPLAGALASAIATCQTRLPPTNALIKQLHLCHPLFDLIVVFSCNTTSIPTEKPSKKRFHKSRLGLVPAKKEPVFEGSLAVRPAFPRGSCKKGTYCRDWGLRDS